ncbi:hypothetical protein [Paenibacillus abyssi]|uniref:Lipoprotein n=1 Tax=Paenibacillus abyssi TaxID=1340531 RepID=A0A917LD10_9BACL|nr:hypothetical protein [Paenibacillus abyssi]GGG14354.1 hypothetical protein GCM10010916_34080 [Paenibacillus abyssi]
MNKRILNTMSLTLAALVALTLTAQAGTASTAVNSVGTTATPTTFVASASSNQVYYQFQSFLKNPSHLPRAIVYLNANIEKANTHQATLMVLHLENAIKKALPSMEERFFITSVQTGIYQVYKEGYNFSHIRNLTKDSSLKSLMNLASASGYKLDSAEGMYFPIINYSIFKKYQPYVKADIKAYIDIMAEESRKAALKDAAIYIGYQELLNRAITQERFITQYRTSNRSAQMNELFTNYKYITFYGTSNTSLFDYPNDEMRPNAKRGYTAILKWNQTDSSEFLGTLREFMDVVAANNYKLTAEVSKFRDTNVPIE